MKPIHIVLDLQTGCNLPLLPKQWWIPIHKNLHPTETRPPRSLNDQYKSGTCISICLLLDLKHFLPFISTFSAVILRATIWNVQQGAKCAALPCFSFYFGSIWKSFFRSFQTKYIKDSSIIIMMMIIITNIKPSINYEALNTRSSWKLCPNWLWEKKTTIPLERSNPPKLMLCMMKNFKLLMQVKILKGDGILTDSSYTWTSLRAFPKGIDCDRQRVPWMPCTGVLVINNGSGFKASALNEQKLWHE